VIFLKARALKDKGDVMRADHTVDFLEDGKCDICKSKIEEGYFIKADNDEEYEKLEKINPDGMLLICEECLYKTFSVETTRIYSCKGTRMRMCEGHLRGDL